MIRAKLILGDCLEVMRSIPSGSVDMVLADPPYGITSCKWDSVIDLQKMWSELKRITHDKSTIVMTSAQPFTTTLIGSNLNDFKYCYTWIKNRPSNFPNAKRRPLTKHEDVCVWQFGSMHYNPQKSTGHKPTNAAYGVSQGSVYRGDNTRNYAGGVTERYPTTILDFKCERGLHPTQKPVDMANHLIRTYTDLGDHVLDFCMGSCWSGMAAIELGRNFTGIELDKAFFGIATNRVKDHADCIGGTKVIEVIHESHPRARKNYPCNASEYLLAGLSDLLSELTWQEKKAVARARRDSWQIKKGDQYIRQFNRDGGDKWTCRAIPAIHDLCVKFDLYVE